MIGTYVGPKVGSSLGDPLRPKVRQQSFRDFHRTISLVEVLDGSHKRATARHTRAIERVYKTRLLFAIARPVSDLGAPRLKITTVRTARNLAVTVLTCQPNLQVIGFGGGKTEITGAQRHHPVRQLEAT